MFRWSALHFDLAERSLSLKQAQEACDQLCLVNRVIRVNLVIDAELFEEEVYLQNRTDALGSVLTMDEGVILLQSEPIALFDLFREFYRILCLFDNRFSLDEWYQHWQVFLERRDRLVKQCRKQGKRWVPIKHRLHSKIQPILEADRRSRFPIWLPYEQLNWHFE